MNLWQVDGGVDVTSAFLGITTPVREIMDEIAQRGWMVSKVDIKDGQYFAQAKNPHGETVEATGPTDATAVGHALLKIMRQEYMRYPVTSTWKTMFVERQGEIALAYAEAPVYDPKAAVGFKELGDDSMRRAEHLGYQLKIEVVDEPNPYKSLQEMCDDVHKKKHIYVTRANAHHPVWTVDQVTAFRLVHDVLGHCSSGGDWSWHGANLAFAAHAPLLSAEGQKALFTETLGQGAYSSTYRAIGPQKVAYLDKLLEDAQTKENAPGHTGVHPSQTLAPGEVATIPGIGEKSSSVVNDPNLNWQSGVTPLPDNGFLWQKVEGPNGWTDPLDLHGLRDHAALLDSGWHSLRQGDGAPDDDSARQAVVNAFRAVLLQPRKERQHGAMHYQGIQHLPAGVDDPLRYFDALEQIRSDSNVGKGYRADLHRLYTDSWQPFKQWVKGLHPTLTDAEVEREARRELFNMQAEEEERLAQDDPESKLSAADLEREAQRELARRLKVLTKGKADEKHDFAEDRIFYSAVPHDVAPYPAFLAHHLKPVAAISHRADDLLRAARHDMHSGGSGHRFRQAVLNMKLPGIGAKEISHAWMLLSPHTSQLAVLSPELLDALGHGAQHLNPRDYYKFERELMAGRDAAGYSHVPLGMFGWGTFDHFNYGPGVHQELSALRPLNATNHHTIDWRDMPQPSTSKAKPYWWESTKEARDAAGKEWDRAYAINTPSDEVPFVKQADSAAAFSTAIPFFTHPQTGETFEGRPGQSLMGHLTESLALSTPAVWALGELEAGKR